MRYEEMMRKTTIIPILSLVLIMLPLAAGVPAEAAAGPSPLTIQAPAVTGNAPQDPAPASALKSGSSLIGYTEAEIRQQLLQKYDKPLPQYRRISGAAADADYQPGTLDVKIPSYFFPKAKTVTVGERFQQNADGSLGIRSETRQAQINQEKTGRDGAAEREPVEIGGKQTVPAVPFQYKTVNVQVMVLGESPFRPLHDNDFLWQENNRGGYRTPLLRSFKNDPLKGLPAEGPMILRCGAENEILSVTMDDPADTYYYKNANTFPSFGSAVPIFTETRKNIQGTTVEIQYIRYYTGGQYSLAVVSAAENAGKIYRTAVVFPESEQYEYLPKALYVIENQRAIPTGPLQKTPAKGKTGA